MLDKTQARAKKPRHYMTDKLLRALSVKNRDGSRKNAFISGPAGSGKTTACRDVATSLGIDFYYTGAAVMPTDFIGYQCPHTRVWIHKEFTRAFINGGVFLNDEADANFPQAQLAINGPIANKFIVGPTGERHEAHKDFVFICAANTWGNGATAEYCGRNKLDAAFLDRFAYRLHWDYDTRLERALAGDDWIGSRVADFINMVRMNVQRNRLKILITPRATIDIADMIRAGFSLREAVSMNFCAGLDREQRFTVLDGTELFFEDLDGTDPDEPGVFDWDHT